MLVNKNISKEIIDDAGITRTIRAERYLNEGKVSIIKTDYKNEDNFTVTSIVSGINDDYEVNIEVEKGELKVASCECRDYQNFYGACKHIVATLMKFEQTRYWDSEAKDGEKNISKNIRHKYRSFNNLVNNFYNAELQEMNKEEKIQLTEEEKIKIEARMDYDKFLHCIKLDFKIGNSRMYKIKDLTEFYTRVINEEFFKYGEKLQFVHSRDNFDNKSKELLDFILRYAEVMKYTNSENRYGYYQGTNIRRKYFR